MFTILTPRENKYFASNTQGVNMDDGAPFYKLLQQQNSSVVIQQIPEQHRKNVATSCGMRICLFSSTHAAVHASFSILSPGWNIREGGVANTASSLHVAAIASLA